MTKTQVLIVGGGIAGLTLAHALQRVGISWSLIEKVPDWKPLGAGIILAANSMRVFRTLGLEENLVARGNQFRDGGVTGRNGKFLGRFDYTHFYEKHKVPTISIHRAELHNGLLEGLPTSQVRTGICLEELTQDEQGVQVKLSDGSQEKYDLLIGADGIHSQIRELILGKMPLRYSGYTCWRFVLDKVHGLDMGQFIEMWGKGMRLGIVPLGKGKVYCFATLNAPAQSSAMRDISLEDFKKLFSRFGGPAKLVLNDLSDRSTLIWNDLEDLRLKQWHKGRIGLVGDAAHPVTPNLGQGAGMAIEDAIVMAEELARHNCGPESLVAFEKRRRARVDGILKGSRRLGRIGQWSSANGLRNAFLKAIPARMQLKGMERILLKDI